MLPPATGPGPEGQTKNTEVIRVHPDFLGKSAQLWGQAAPHEMRPGSGHTALTHIPENAHHPHRPRQQERAPRPLTETPVSQ